MSPAANVFSLCPGVMSTYFRPSAERGRTRIVVSVGERLDGLVELHVDDRDGALAVAVSTAGLDVVDDADAEAADADLVALTRFAPLGSSALMS